MRGTNIHVTYATRVLHEHARHADHHIRQTNYGPKPAHGCPTAFASCSHLHLGTACTHNINNVMGCMTILNLHVISFCVSPRLGLGLKLWPSQTKLPYLDGRVGVPSFDLGTKAPKHSGTGATSLGGEGCDRQVATMATWKWMSEVWFSFSLSDPNSNNFMNARSPIPVI